jgi:hypothetical protein
VPEATIALTPDEIRLIGLGFLRSYAGHAGDEWSILAHEIAYRSGWGLGDAALWGDWVDSVWRVRGIEEAGPSVDFESYPIKYGNGAIGEARVITLANTRYGAEGASPHVGNPDGPGVTYSEVSAFVIFSAFVQWSGWDLASVTLSSLTEELSIMSLPDRSPVSIMWGPFFNSQLARNTDDGSASMKDT